jgi:hypothetical protein
LDTPDGVVEKKEVKKSILKVAWAKISVFLKFEALLYLGIFTIYCIA